MLFVFDYSLIQIGLWVSSIYNLESSKQPLATHWSSTVVRFFRIYKSLEYITFVGVAYYFLTFELVELEYTLSHIIP